jgi:hypothetical protein
MGSVPQHPFFLRVIELLQKYDRHWLLPYITVMYSTGPLFLSVIWKEYMQDKPSEAGRVRILMQDEYNKFSWSFFTHHRGNSWHGKDAHLIFWVSRYFQSIRKSQLTYIDGSTLGFSHNVRLPRCWNRWILPLVELRPNYAPRCAIPLSIHESAYPLESIALVYLTDTALTTYCPNHSPPSQLQRRRRIRRSH